MKAPPAFNLLRLLTGGYTAQDLKLSVRDIVKKLPTPKPVEKGDPDKNSEWKFWRSYNITHPENPEETYLFRIYVIQTPWFAVLYHEFEKSDHDRHLHDHPFDFVSLILEGGYTEETFHYGPSTPYLKEDHYYPTGSILVRPATSSHRVKISQSNKPTTLVLTGPRIREWGFWEDGSWVQWERYLARYAK